MNEDSGDRRDATRVFEVATVYKDWDTDYYDPISEALYDQAVAEMLTELGAAPGSLVLDAGCGPGVHSVRAIRRGHRVRAIDISDVALETTRARAEKLGVAAALSTGRENLTQLSFPDETFETIFSWGVLTHIPDIEKALAELARVLKQGGRLALQVNNRVAWDNKLERVTRFVLRRANRALERLPMGDGCWYEFHGEKLWVWQSDLPAIARYLEPLGLRLVRRRAIEATHLHRYLRGGLRSAVLRLNNLWYCLGLPAGPAITNLAIFEKA
jgi:ubiquinone/menaquinone biosynthesis C-methylase UbiE